MEISENLVDLRSHVLSIDLESTHVKDFRNLTVFVLMWLWFMTPHE